MITNFFIFLFYLFTEVYDYVPEWSMPSAWLETVNTLLSYALSFEGLIPIRTMLGVAFTILAFELLIWLTKLGMAVLNFVRGSGKLEF